uniref:C2H2-type domain-containing protein n=1 Tax=Heliothis virescens TaxID=7102 RepID=A0A2A4K9U8_HELVI
MCGQPLDCPVCWNKSFSSKQTLLYHLTNALENSYCPVCICKCTSLAHLVEHLSEDKCQPDSNVHKFEHKDNEDTIIQNRVIENSEIRVLENDINTSDKDHFEIENVQEIPAETNEPNKMYVDLFGKPMKPCLQTGELRLVKENGESRYMIVTPDPGLSAESTIVTKQNNDGTISLTTIKDMKMESESSIATDSMPDDNQEEIYSCNTCKVSFTSVIEHIQNYHNDQDVVVEEPLEDNQNDTIPIEYEPTDHEESMVTSDKQTPRRVITDTGDIVEEPLEFKPDSQFITPDSMPDQMETIKAEKKGKRFVTKRVLQVDKICDSVIKDAMKTDGKVKYPCLYCPVAYENSKSLCAHMKVHKMKSGNVASEPISYECDICNTIFPTNKSLKLHKRMHDPVKSRPIEFPVENTDGSQVSDRQYICPICDKVFPIDYKHIHQNSHKSSAKINCGICNKKFTSREYLEMHANVHNIDKVPVNKQDKNLPYNCIYCNRRFARPHEKVKHERIHTGEKPHSCEICGKSFRVSYCLTLHMRTHTGARPYACQQCGKRFKAHSVYNHHLLTHSEVRAYKCPFCPKAFKTSVQLAGHKNSHTKPFQCQHCNRPFASLYAVRVHTETHARQNNLKFSCEMCGASYARAFALKDHIKQAHKQEPPPSPTQTIPTEEEWNNPDADHLNKDLTHEIDLGISSNELIVP